jgi:hypothetical protein
MPLASRRTHPRARARGERGIGLVVALFTIAALLVAMAGALVTGASNSRAAWNYKGASQAHFVAEAGLSDAIQNINATGVIHYQNDIVTPWTSRWPGGYFPRSFSPLAGYSYTVTTAAGTDPQNAGRLVSTATGPDGVTNTVVANLVRNDQPTTAPGAIYLATDSQTNATFNGNAFIVDGNDRNYTGGFGPGLAVPGISTRNAGNTTETISSLAGNPMDNVQGLGFQAGPPVVPSVATSPSAPTIAQMNQFIADLQASPGAQVCGCAQINNSCSCDFGTPPPANPPICTITTFGTGGNNQIKNNGNVNGCGVMIVNGNLDVQGSVNFKGLVLVKGQLVVTGNATLYGSVWAQGVNLTVGGSAIVYHSTQALDLANEVVPSGTIMAPMNVASLADCAALPAGTGGCP